jgi:DNA-binding response OmpR family regulator
MTRRILVIDDDAAVRETIMQTLDERGYDVITEAWDLPPRPASVV